MIDDSKLKPCPFCGEKAVSKSEIDRGIISIEIVCTTCGANINRYKDVPSSKSAQIHIFFQELYEIVMDLWNKRA